MGEKDKKQQELKPPEGAPEVAVLFSYDKASRQYRVRTAIVVGDRVTEAEVVKEHPGRTTALGFALDHLEQEVRDADAVRRLWG